MLIDQSKLSFGVLARSLSKPEVRKIVGIINKCAGKYTGKMIVFSSVVIITPLFNYMYIVGLFRIDSKISILSI